MIEQEIMLTNPFPGLRPFETDENYLFFGRDGQSDEVLSKLRASRFVAVVGTSGSGKSSLVRAGLLPALFSGHMTSAGSSWRVAVFRPGNNPIGNLATALADPGVFGTGDREAATVRLENIERTLRRSSLGLLEVVAQARMAPHENLLILADQFEELFRFRKKSTAEHPEDEAAAFVKLLLEAKQQDRSPEERLPIYVILTMRSDYLGDCAHFWGLPEAINDGQFLIPRMTDDDRREAITGPVIIAGGAITAPLVNRLLNDVGDDPAQLPILQHALMRTWDYWKKYGKQSEPIGIPHYEQMGGMAQALSNHANEAFLDLSPDLQVIAEKLFKCLTEKEADNREGRRPATVAEICAVTGADEEQVKTVIESFRREGRSFLMPPPSVPLATDTLIDISHESLIKGWDRLRKWVDDEAQSARQYTRFANRASQFPESEDYLRDPALHIALKWLEDNKPSKEWALRYHDGFDKTIEYLAASKANREAEIAEKERQQKEKVERELRHANEIAEEQKRRANQLRRFVVLLVLLLLMMMGVTVFAFQQRGRAVSALEEVEKQRDVAERAKIEADERRDDAERSKVEADRQRDIAEGALGAAQTERDKARAAQKEADDQRIRAEKALKEAQVERDKARAARVDALRQTAIAVEAREAAIEAEGEARDAKEEAERERDTATRALATVDEIDRSAPFFKSIMRGHTEKVDTASLSPDGSFVITTSGDGTSRVWDPVTGKPKPVLPSEGPVSSESLKSTANRVVLSDSGKLMLISRFIDDEIVGERPIEIWDLEANKKLASTSFSKRQVATAIFSPDDKFIITQHEYDGNILIHDARTGVADRYAAGPDPVKEFVFTPDGKRFVIVSADASVLLKDVETAFSLRDSFGLELSGHLDEVNTARFSPDEKFLVTASNDGTAIVWDSQTGSILTKLSGHEGAVNSAVFDHTGKYIVTTSKKHAYLWEAISPGNWTKVSPNSPTILAGHTGDVTRAVFSRDGKWVIAISQDRTAQLWPSKTAPGKKEGEIVQPAVVSSSTVFRGHIKPVTSLAISKDSKYLLTGSEDKTARVWDLTAAGGFNVENLELKAEPADFEGKCPVTVKFRGLITVTGGSGTVKYRFVSEDGRASLPQELLFDAPGSKEVSTTREVYGGVSRSGAPLPTSGGVELEILDPVQKKSRAEYKVRCTDQGSQPPDAGELTSEQLKQIMPRSTDQDRSRYVGYLQSAMEEFGINTPLRRAAFLAQVAFNTAELRFLEVRAPDATLESQYGGRKDLGNFEPGDGARYKGRGAFFITGRSVYKSLGGQLGVDLIAKPELAASPEVAFRTAALFWQRNNLNEMADKQDLETISRRINSTTRDIVQQKEYFERAKTALGVTVQPR